MFSDEENHPRGTAVAAAVAPLDLESGTSPSSEEEGEGDDAAQLHPGAAEVLREAWEMVTDPAHWHWRDDVEYSPIDADDRLVSHWDDGPQSASPLRWMSYIERFGWANFVSKIDREFQPEQS